MSTINIHGKEYKPVAMRVNELKEKNPDWSILTEIIQSDDNVIMKSTVVDETGRVRGTGFAEEVRGSTNINKTSALENCETSAIGRALAACGFAGTEYASANEVTDAIIQQQVQTASEEWVKRCGIIRESISLITDLKDRLADEDYPAAAETSLSFPEDLKWALNLAPSKGGMLSTKEIKQMQSNEFFEAKNAITGFDPKLDKAG